MPLLYRQGTGQAVLKQTKMKALGIYICINIPSTVGHNTVGHDTLGHNTVGPNTMGHDTVVYTVAAGHSPVGHAVMHTLGHCIH